MQLLSDLVLYPTVKTADPHVAIRIIILKPLSITLDVPDA